MIHPVNAAACITAFACHEQGMNSVFTRSEKLAAMARRVVGRMVGSATMP
jgi:hypothetical protein